VLIFAVVKVKLNAECMGTSEIRTTLLRGLLCTRLKSPFSLWFAMFFSFFLLSCANDKWEVEPSSVEFDTPFSTLNFIEDIQELPGIDSLALNVLQQKYGAFWVDYSEDILKIGASNKVSTIKELRRFVSHPDTKETLDAIDTTSGDKAYLHSIEKTLEAGFKRFHAFMPKETIPTIIWMPSGFNYAIYPRKEYVAVGVEWFLGPEHHIIGLLPPDRFPQYQQLRMHPDLMAGDTFRGWLLVYFSASGYTGERCIDDILYWGKILWLMKKCLPELHDHLLMDWTPDKLQWAEANESAIWLELQPSKVLFETNRTIYKRWLSDGPFTKAGAIPQESPDRLGIWMGWRIVEDYMDRNPETTIEELFNEQDHIPFLKSYRPEH
jgi:hypothetical protein